MKWVSLKCGKSNEKNVPGFKEREEMADFEFDAGKERGREAKIAEEERVPNTDAMPVRKCKCYCY